MYHFKMTLKSGDTCLPVYVLTNEEDQHLFDLWEQLPRADDYEAWKKVNNVKINAFEQKLQSLVKVQKPSKFIVQLLITESGEPFFKLYDTIFLP